MFSDFDAKDRHDEGRGRRTVSLLLAALIFAGLAVAISFAIATAHAVVQQREREVDVEFAALEPRVPEPVVEAPPPPPPPPPPPERRRRLPRGATVGGPPRSIPDARPAEAEGELVESGPTGPGSEEGIEGGQGPVREPEPAVEPAPPAPPPAPARPPAPPPAQERIEVAPPRLLSGCETPERPDTLEGATAATITIYVRVVVGPDGRVLRATIEEPHPLVPDRAVLGCVETRMYEPAHLPDGTSVPYPLRYAFTFRPDVL